MQQAFNAKTTADEVLDGIDLTGTNVLLTGCASGLGFETLRVLTAHGAHVIAAARTLAAAEQACARAGGSTTPLACDLADLAAVRRACAQVIATGLPLHRIIANAGIMMLPRLEQIDGIEKQFYVNFLAHYALIAGVLGAVPRHAGARIVILASEAHRRAPPGGVELENLSGERDYEPMRAYGQSNVARILYARALARRLADSGITANSLHPGVIGSTALFRHLNPLLRGVVRLFSKTIAQGAATQCYVAAHPPAQGITGQYFSDCHVATSPRRHADQRRPGRCARRAVVDDRRTADLTAGALSRRRASTRQALGG